MNAPALISSVASSLSPHPLFRSPLDDELRGALVLARLVALGRLAPRRHRMPAARGLALAAPERMIDRIHRHATVVRALAEMARPSGLAVGDVLVLEVADLPDGRVAADVHLPHLARGEAERGPVAFAGHELRRGTGRAHHLAALPFLQLDVVNRRAEGDLGQRKGIADQYVGIGAGGDRRADGQAVRPEDVAVPAG